MQARARIQIVRADPRDAAQKQNDQRRDGPHDEFDLASIGPVGASLRAFVAGAKPPGEKQCADDDRNHHGQHDDGCIEKYGALGFAHGPVGIEHAAAAAAQ
jgi:hypothetical protein